ncbi:MAG: hypothetical protein ACRDDF_04375 [Aeromonas sp.]
MMIGAHLNRTHGQVVKTKNFKDVDDFLRKNSFQLINCKRNMLTLIYIFKEEEEEFFIKDRFVYLSKAMEFIDNEGGESFIKEVCVDSEKRKVEVAICTLDYFIDCKSGCSEYDKKRYTIKPK